MRVATVDGKDEADAAGIAWAGRAMVASGRWDEAAWWRVWHSKSANNCMSASASLWASIRRRLTVRSRAGLARQQRPWAALASGSRPMCRPMAARRLSWARCQRRHAGAIGRCLPGAAGVWAVAGQSIVRWRMAERLAELVRGGVLILDDCGVAVDLLRELAPADRPAAIVHPRHNGRPETTAARLSKRERSMRAADGLGRALAVLERADAWRRRW
jgi:hypothetical protein